MSESYSKRGLYMIRLRSTSLQGATYTTSLVLLPFRLSFVSVALKSESDGEIE